MEVLIRFTHGLGDAVQLTVVLKHLAKYRPDWQVDVWGLVGKHTAWRGLCRRAYSDRDPQPATSRYQQVFELGWYENYNGYSDRPNTKVTNCLDEVFKIPYDPELGGYAIAEQPEDAKAAVAYLKEIGCSVGENGRWNAIAIHHMGNTSPERKNLNDTDIMPLVDWCRSRGIVPIILDWDRRTKIADNVAVFNPGADHPLWLRTGTGDAGRIAALVRRLAAYVGVDSGPQKCAAATDTPAVGVWTGHLPIQFMDASPNFVHLVPSHWGAMPPVVGRPAIAAFAAKFHRLKEYADRGKLGLDIVAAVAELVGDRKPAPAPVDAAWTSSYGFWVRKDHLDQDLTVVRDVYVEDSYKTKLYGPDRGPEVIVDIGAHIGCFAKLWHEKNPLAKIVCVEACSENIPLLRANVGEFATVIHAACTYVPGELRLLNSATVGRDISTGGSVVVGGDGVEMRQPGYRYNDDRRPLRKVSLEEILQEIGADHIDLLKLDCEGSEFSILQNTPSLNRIRFIFGEWHDTAKWNALRAGRLAGWDYGEMSRDDANSRGVFHLVNPTWPPRSPKKNWRTGSAVGRALAAVVLPDEIGAMADWIGYYEILFDAVQVAKPKAIVEVGVRAGYGSFIASEAAPAASVTGIESDSEPMSRGYFRNANEIMEGRKWNLVHADSNALTEFPACDFSIIDGDHTFESAKNDLAKSVRAGAMTIVVDDVHPGNGVERAVSDFLIYNRLWSSERRPTGDGAREVAILRKSDRPLRIAIAQGIGDTLWVMTKIQALLDASGANACELSICGGTSDYRANRSLSLLGAFPFVAKVTLNEWEVVDRNPAPVRPDGSYNYSESQPGWHGFDWLLQCNGHLERGGRLEDWMPHLATNWRIMDLLRIDAADAQFAEEFAKAGPYVCVYFGPAEGNGSGAGHNRGPRWTPENWRQLIEQLPAGVRVVGIGAKYDRGYFEGSIRPAGVRCEDCLGQWEIGRTVEVIRRAKAVVAYQSGLGVLAAYLGTPAIMWWRKDGDYIDEGSRLTFRESMATAWAPPESLAAGKYVGAIYGRETPDELAGRVSNWLEIGGNHAHTG